MKQDFCDLHVHTNRSDALRIWTPEKVLLRAKSLGIMHVAISDHNIVNEEWQEQSLQTGVDVISSTEMSSRLILEENQFEPHIVGFRVNPKAETIRQIVKKHQQSRKGYLMAMLNGLRADPEDPIDISYEELTERNPDSFSIGRVAIGEIIIERKKAKDMQEVYARRLGRESGAPSYVDSKTYLKYENVELVIQAIIQSGGLAIAAHLPYYGMTEEEEYQFLSIVKDTAGHLAGMETEYAGYPKSTVDRLKRLAKYFGMVESTGSDFHGYEGSDLLQGNPEIYKTMQSVWEKYHYG